MQINPTNSDTSGRKKKKMLATLLFNTRLEPLSYFVQFWVRWESSVENFELLPLWKKASRGPVRSVATGCANAHWKHQANHLAAGSDLMGCTGLLLGALVGHQRFCFKVLDWLRWNSLIGVTVAEGKEN